jgi:acyl dehydratase
MADQLALPLYFEDAAEGLVLDTASRTITDDDILDFARFSGDWNPIHVDEERAREGRFGRRVLHGVAGFALMGGLIHEAGWFSTTMVAALGYESLEFAAPVFPGDTLSCRMTILDRRLTRRGRGLVRRRLELINQRGEVVQRSISSVFIARREEST